MISEPIAGLNLKQNLHSSKRFPSTGIRKLFTTYEVGNSNLGHCVTLSLVFNYLLWSSRKCRHFNSLAAKTRT